MYVLNGFEVFDYLEYARVILIDWLIGPRLVSDFLAYALNCFKLFW